MIYGPKRQRTTMAVPVLLVIVSLVACWIPARRAARADPLPLHYE
jgi:ABC-type lipoprotein release transport system permease subunit